MKNQIFIDPQGHLTDAAKYLYIDALNLDKTPELPGEILDHVQECLRCKRAILEIHDLVRDRDYTSLQPHPYFDQKKVQSKSPISISTRLAAAIIIGLGIAFLAYFYFPDTHKTIVIDDPVDEPAEVIPDEIETPDTETADLFAANFQPSPFYEMLIDQQFRAPAIRILSPDTNEEITGNILFSWETPAPMTVHLQILDNTENIIWQTTTDRYTVTFSSDLDPGIYYWRLETDEELLHVGKIIVPVP